MGLYIERSKVLVDMGLTGYELLQSGGGGGCYLKSNGM